MRQLSLMIPDLLVIPAFLKPVCYNTVRVWGITVILRILITA